MQHLAKIGVGALLAIVVIAQTSFAATNGSREEAIAMVQSVQTMFTSQGEDATVQAINNQEFNDRDLYPFIFTLEGVGVAHGAKASLVGKDLSGLKDVDGIKLIQEMIKLTVDGGSGWVDYKWPNPTNNKVEEKSAYVENIGGDYFVAVGIYRN